MAFLRKLFGGGGRSSADRDGMYIFIRPKMCKEVVRVRVNLLNDLSALDEGGYFVRKMVSATRCPFQAEVELTFDKSRNLIQSAVTNGEWLEASDYEAWLEQQAES
jgi:hypothetical protein